MPFSSTQSAARIPKFEVHGSESESDATQPSSPAFSKLKRNASLRTKSAPNMRPRTSRHTSSSPTASQATASPVSTPAAAVEDKATQSNAATMLRQPTRSDSLNSISSLEDVAQRRSRGRKLDRTTESELHHAVATIKQTRSLSPSGEGRRPSDPHVVALPILNKSASTIALPTLSLRGKDESALDVANYMTDDDIPSPHKMIRKKSGELVRSSLKPGKGRRPSSMPATPNGSKNVHFDRKLEHVRHFLYTEKPAAVSTTTSPTQEYADELGFPWGKTGADVGDNYELSIELPNFIPEAQQAENSGAIIKVETVYLSSDRKSLIGRVAVRNLSFEKSVRVRYTMDSWRTTSESAAEHTNDVRKKHRDDGFDRFLFDIKIDDFSGVTDKTMFFCVRYNVAGQEYWDSNGGQNFRVEFHNRERQRRVSLTRRGSDPPARKTNMSLDDEAIRAEVSRTHSHRNVKSDESLIFENIYDNRTKQALEEELERPIPMKRGRKVNANDAFSNRYDFGASLSAAIAAANSMLQGSGDEIQQKTPRPNFSSPAYNPYFGDVSPQVGGEVSPPSLAPFVESPMTATPLSSGDNSPRPGTGTGTNPLAHNNAYQTLLHNYCFFGTARAAVPSGPAPSSSSTAMQRSASRDEPQTAAYSAPIDIAPRDDRSVTPTLPHAGSPAKHHILADAGNGSGGASPSLCGLSSLNDSPAQDIRSGASTPVIRT